MRIEHFGGDWCVFNHEYIAVASVPGWCALEACTSRVWNVGSYLYGEPQVPQPSVKMLYGADAEREVSCRRLYARCSAPSINARARARVFIVIVLHSLKIFVSRRPLKAKPKLLLQPRPKLKRMPRLLPKRRRSLRALRLWSCCSGWTCSSTSQSSCEGEGGELARCCAALLRRVLQERKRGGHGHVCHDCG